MRCVCCNKPFTPKWDEAKKSFARMCRSCDRPLDPPTQEGGEVEYILLTDEEET